MQSRPPVAAPALSQIPGLNKTSSSGKSENEEPQRQLFRDTDSAYVRLAKQGGRTDLLRMDQDSTPMHNNSEPRPLPDWMQRDAVGNE